MQDPKPKKENTTKEDIFDALENEFNDFNSNGENEVDIFDELANDFDATLKKKDEPNTQEPTGQGSENNQGQVGAPSPTQFGENFKPFQDTSEQSGDQLKESVPTAEDQQQSVAGGNGSFSDKYKSKEFEKTGLVDTNNDGFSRFKRGWEEGKKANEANPNYVYDKLTDQQGQIDHANKRLKIGVDTETLSITNPIQLYSSSSVSAGENLDYVTRGGRLKPIDYNDLARKEQSAYVQYAAEQQMKGITDQDEIDAGWKEILNSGRTDSEFLRMYNDAKNQDTRGGYDFASKSLAFTQQVLVNKFEKLEQNPTFKRMISSLEEIDNRLKDNDQLLESSYKYEERNALIEQRNKIVEGNSELLNEYNSIIDANNNAKEFMRNVIKYSPESASEMEARLRNAKALDQRYSEMSVPEKFASQVMGGFANKLAMTAFKWGASLPQVVGSVANTGPLQSQQEKYNWADSLSDWAYDIANVAEETYVPMQVQSINGEYIPTNNFRSSIIEKNKETGENEIHWERAVHAVGGVGADMAILLAGGGLISKAIKGGVEAVVGAKRAMNVAQGVGLFTSSYAMTAPEYFRSAREAGIPDAKKFSQISATITSALELISPNTGVTNSILGNMRPFTQVAFEAIKKGATTKGGIQKALGWYIKEILGENVQEMSQSIADFGLEAAANHAYNQEFYDVSKERMKHEAMETALLTTLTTGIISIKGGINEYRQHMPYDQAIDFVARNHDKYMPILHKYIQEDGIDSKNVDRIYKDISERRELLRDVGNKPYYVNKLSGLPVTREEAMKNPRVVDIHNDPGLQKMRDEMVARDVQNSIANKIDVSKASVEEIANSGAYVKTKIDGKEVTGYLKEKEGNVVLESDEGVDHVLGDTQSVYKKTGSEFSLEKGITRPQELQTMMDNVFSSPMSDVSMFNAITQIENKYGNEPLTLEEKERLNDIKVGLKNIGYESTDIKGQPFTGKEGYSVVGTVADPNLEKGKEEIREVVEPRIDHEGKMVKSPKVVVAFGTKTETGTVNEEVEKTPAPVANTPETTTPETTTTTTPETATPETTTTTTPPPVQNKKGKNNKQKVEEKGNQIADQMLDLDSVSEFVPGKELAYYGTQGKKFKRVLETLDNIMTNLFQQGKKPRVFIVHNKADIPRIQRIFGHSEGQISDTTRGWYSRKYNMAVLTPSTETAIHEMLMHPVIDMVKAMNPGLYNEFKEQIQKIVDQQSRLKYVDIANQSYKGFSEETKVEEAIVNFLTKVSDRNLDKSLWEQLRNVITDFLTKIGFISNDLNDPIRIELKDNLRLKDFANTLAKAIEQSRQIEIVAKQEQAKEEQEKKDSFSRQYPLRPLAPNGKPSNLNSRQWDQVRTPEFKAWFGDWQNDPGGSSQMLDENGEPKVYYHVSKAEIGTFDYSKTVGGFFFAETPEDASGFFEEYRNFETAGRSVGQNTIPVFLNIRNPKVYQSFYDDYIPAQIGKSRKELNNELVQKDKDGIVITDKYWHDGVTDKRGGQAVAFYPEAIKSAIGNTGEFSKDNPDISFSREDSSVDNEYFDAIRRGDMETAQRLVDEAAKKSNLPLVGEMDTPAYEVRTGAPPKKTMKLYKAFRMIGGQLFPLYVSVDGSPIPMGTWLDAKDGGEKFTLTNSKGQTLSYVLGKTGSSINFSDFHPEDEKRLREMFNKPAKGKKSPPNSMKFLAYRPAWHSGDAPINPQGAGSQDPKFNKDKPTKEHPYMYRLYKDNPDFGTVVIAEIEMSADKDYKKEYEETAVRNKDGSININMSGLRYVPKDGLYAYTTNSNNRETSKKKKVADWYLGGSIKVNRVLPQEEIHKILDEKGILRQHWDGDGKINLDELGYNKDLEGKPGKSTSVITYDKDGKIIPLSQRFNPESDDVSFSKEIHDMSSGSNINVEGTEDINPGKTLGTVRMVKPDGTATVEENNSVSDLFSERITRYDSAVISHIRKLIKGAFVATNKTGGSQTIELPHEDEESVAEIDRLRLVVRNNKSSSSKTFVSEYDKQHDKLRNQRDKEIEKAIAKGMHKDKVKELRNSWKERIDAFKSDADKKVNDALDQLNSLTQRLYNEYKEVYKQNIKALWDSLTPEFREMSKKWYEGANRFAQSFASTYNLTMEQAAGIIAVLSPQKDWFNNVSAAERVVNILTLHSDTEFTKEMLDKTVAYVTRNFTKKDWASANAKYAKYLASLNKPKTEKKNEEEEDTESSEDAIPFHMAINNLFELYKKEGKKFTLNNMKGETPEVQAVLLRALDHAINDPSVPETDPTGAVIRKEGGAVIMWNSMAEIGRAMELYRNPDLENISAQIGKGNKVRNFYNNIVDPNSINEYLTADTHALSVVLGAPVSASGAGAYGLFAGGKSPAYALVKDAYIEAARELGILPRELQSVTWEAQRTGINDKNRTPETKEKTFAIIKKNKQDKNKTPYDRAREVIQANPSKPSGWATARGITVQRAESEGTNTEGTGKTEPTQDTGDGTMAPVRDNERESDRGGDTNVDTGDGLDSFSKAQVSETVKRVIEPKMTPYQRQRNDYIRSGGKEYPYVTERQKLKEMSEFLDQIDLNETEINKELDKIANGKFAHKPGDNNFGLITLIKLFQHAELKGFDQSADRAFEMVIQMGSSIGQLLRQMREFKSAKHKRGGSPTQRLKDTRRVVRGAIRKFTDKLGYALDEYQDSVLDDLIQDYAIAIADENMAHEEFIKNPNDQTRQTYVDAKNKANATFEALHSFLTENVPPSLRNTVKTATKGNMLTLNSQGINVTANAMKAGMIIPEGTVAPVLRDLYKLAGGKRWAGANTFEAWSAMMRAGWTFSKTLFPSLYDAFREGGKRDTDIEKFDIVHELHPLTALNQLIGQLAISTTGKKTLFGKQLKSIPKKRIVEDGITKDVLTADAVLGKMVEGPMGIIAAINFRLLWGFDKPFKEAAKVFYSAMEMYRLNDLDPNNAVPVNGRTIEDFINNADEQQKEKMHRYAENFAYSDKTTVMASTANRTMDGLNTLAEMGYASNNIGFKTLAVIADIFSLALAPFITVPANVSQHLLESMLPPLALASAYTAYKEGDKQMGDERIGRAFSGMILWATGMALISAGLIVAGDDEEWDSENASLKQSIGGPKSLNLSALNRWIYGGFDNELAKRKLTDVVVPLDKLGMPGLHFGAMSRLKERLQKNERWSDPNSYWDSITNLMMDSPAQLFGTYMSTAGAELIDMSVFKGQMNLLEALSEGKDAGMARFLSGTADTWANLFVPNQVSMGLQKKHDYMLKAKSKDWVQMTKEVLAKRIGVKIDGMDYVLNIWGEDVPVGEGKFFSPFKSRELTDPIAIQLAQIMADANVADVPFSFPSDDLKVGDLHVKLNEQDHVALLKTTGFYRKKVLEKFFENANEKFHNAPPDIKYKIIKELMSEISTGGKEIFTANWLRGVDLYDFNEKTGMFKYRDRGDGTPPPTQEFNKINNPESNFK